MGILTNENLISPYIVSKDVKASFKDSLTLYCYTKQHYFRKDAWDDITIQCRGIVFDENGKVVSRPFPKIFNIGENSITHEFVEEKMNEEYIVFDKVNGHLAIAFIHDDKLYVTTKGSFDSEYSELDYQICVDNNIESLIRSFNKPVTVCMEIVADYDKHCMTDQMVDTYGSNTCVILSIIDNETGLYIVPTNKMKAHYTFVKEYSTKKDLKEMYSHKNIEGYVLFFPDSNLFVKVKCDEYWAERQKFYGLNANKFLKDFAVLGYDASIIKHEEEYKPIFDFILKRFYRFMDFYLDKDYLINDLYYQLHNRKWFALHKTLSNHEKIFVLDCLFNNKPIFNIKEFRKLFTNSSESINIVQHYINTRWMSDKTKTLN